METQKIIVILLIVAIIFSVASVLFNVSFVRNMSSSELKTINLEDVSISGNVGLEVIPQGVSAQ